MLWTWKICSKLKMNYQKSHYEELVNANQTFKMGLFVCFYGSYILTEYIENTVLHYYRTFHKQHIFKHF